MKKYNVLKTTVLNRSTRDNSILEESSEILASFAARNEAETFMTTLDLDEAYGDRNLYKEIMEIEEE